MSTLYFECNMGAAGDMLMAGLYEICDQKDLFLKTMNETFAPFGITITATESEKCGIHGTKMQIMIGDTEETPEDHTHNHVHPEHMHNHEQEEHSHEHLHSHGQDEHTHEHHHGGHIHTDYPSILERISALSLPDAVKKDITAIYQIIGEAESKVHQTPLDQIHFHEVGSLDALADVSGCALLMYLIAPDEIISSPIHVGNGFVKCAHGVLSVPAPATAEILKGIPYYTGSITSELLTPTGAAILKYYVQQFSAMPSLVTEAIGYGMGTKDFEVANCVRIFYGKPFEEKNETPSQSIESFPSDDRILSISCNLDDMTGEALGLASEILIAAGALDVYTIPIQMKKNRPGILLTCLCNIEDKDKFTGLFFLHTTTRGVRYQTYERAKLESTFESRNSPYGSIRIKKSKGYGVEKEKPEFEDLKSIVLKKGCSIEEITKNINS